MENEAKASAPRSRERGKGKNNNGTTRVLFQVSCQPEEREQIKELAEKAGKTTSKFLVDLALGRN